MTVNGGAWTAYTSPITLSNGKHAVQFRATDKAGNASQITQSIAVDTEGPVVHLPSKWTLGQGVKFTITDPVSGLATARVVIEDQAEKYKKVHWDKTVSSISFSGEINWDGRFADGAIAPPGDYEVWVKTSDNAGNETFQLGWVTVPEPSVFSWILPPPTTPTAAPMTAPSPTPMPTIQPTATVQPALSAVEASAPSKPAVIMVSSSSAGGVSNTQPTPDPVQSNLPLVSAAVAAMAAAAAYEAKRKQEAERLAIAARNAKRNGKKDTNPMSYRQIAKAYAAAKYNFNATLNKAQEMGMGVEEVAKLKDDVAKSGTIGASLGTAQGYIVQKKAEQEAQAAAKRQQMEEQRAEKKEALLSSPALSMQVPPQADGYDAVEALRARNAAANSDVSASKPWWQNALEVVTATTQKSIGALIAPASNGPTSVLNRISDGNPITDFFNWVGQGLDQIGKTISSWLGGGKQPNAMPAPTPTLNPTAVNQALQTLVAPFTQTAQAKPTLIPTLTPPPHPTFMPTPLPANMWVTYPVYLRGDASLNNPPLVLLDYYSQVQFTGDTASSYDKEGNPLILYKVLVPSLEKTGWVASSFLENNSISTPLSIDSTKKVFISEIYRAPNQQAQDLMIGFPRDPSTGRIVTDPTGNISLVKTDVVNFNLCGEFSAAYVTGRPIDTLITDWVNQKAGYWQDRARQIINDPSRLTGIDDIKNMLDQYNCSYQDFPAPFKVDPLIGKPIITPNQLKAQLDQGNALIIGVNANQQGILAQGNVGHWVVVDSIAPQGVDNGQVNAQVLIYNSMPNGQQIVDYKTLLKASGELMNQNEPNYPPDKINPAGLWVNLNETN